MLFLINLVVKELKYYSQLNFVLPLKIASAFVLIDNF